MPTFPSFGMRRLTVLTAVIGGLLGFLLNLLNVTLLPDNGLFFGGLFYPALALRCGPVAGCLAARIAPVGQTAAARVTEQPARAAAIGFEIDAKV